MPSKQRPQARRAGRRGAKRTESISTNVRLSQSGRTGKRRSIPLSQLSERSSASRDRALHVLANMRHNPSLSLAHGAKLEGVKPETVKKYFPSALKKSNGKLQATKSDRYTATLYIPDVYGNPVAIKTRSWKEREALGKYLRDLGRYLRGDRNALSAWRGKKVAGTELLTVGRAITAIEPALSDFSLYRALNAGGE
jgi:hypothetical protein